MSQLFIADYVFDPVNGRITLTDIENLIPNFGLHHIKLITNISRGSILYLPQLEDKRGSWNGTYIQLLVDTTTMSAEDKLQIVAVDSDLLDRQLRDFPVDVNVKDGHLIGTAPTAWNKLLNHYVFDASEKKVKFPVWPLGYVVILQNQIISIVNATRNSILYCPSVAGKGGTLATEDGIRVLTLDFDTTEMSDTDKLQIVVAIPPATHYARNKSVAVSNVSIAKGGTELQSFEIEPVIPVETQLNYSDSIEIDPQARVLQVIRMSSDAINKIIVGAYGVLIPGDEISVDNFNSYADTTVLRQTWVPSNNAIDVQLATGEAAQEGTGALSFLVKRQSIGATVSKVYSSDQDWSARIAIHFQHRSSVLSSGVDFLLRIRDVDNNWAYKNIGGALIVDWHEHIIPFHEFVTEVNAVDLSKIREIQFVPIDHNAESREFIDNLEIKGWNDNQAELGMSIYHLGSSEPTVNDLLPDPEVLLGGVTIRNFVLGYGPGVVEADLTLANLIKNDYYGIAIRNFSNYHKMILLTSPEPAYLSGGTYLIDNGNISTKLPASLYFSVMAPIASFYSDIEITFNDDPGHGSLLWISLIDGNGRLIHAIASMTLGHQRNVKFDCADDDFSYWWERGVQTIVGYFQRKGPTRATSFEVKSSIFHAKHRPNG